MSDNFDFSAFLKGAATPDDSVRKAEISAAVSDEMETRIGEVAPRIWSVIYEQMMLDPKNNIHLNAVMNSAIFALLSWVCAMTPSSEDPTKDSDDAIRQRILANLDNALLNSRGQGQLMVMLAHNVGKLKLMEDSLKGLSNTLVSNSMIIKGIHSYIQAHPKG
jgi:hypothetical protein